MSLGSIARRFGARALVCNIVHHLLLEYTKLHYVNYNAQTVLVSYWEDHETSLDFEHNYWIQRGTDESLFKLWLDDIDFRLAYKEHSEWASRLEDEIEREWETTGEHMNDDGHFNFEQRQRTLQAREDEIRAEI
jgi:hypothetical protein